MFYPEWLILLHIYSFIYSAIKHLPRGNLGTNGTEICASCHWLNRSRNQPCARNCTQHNLHNSKPEGTAARLLERLLSWEQSTGMGLTPGAGERRAPRDESHPRRNEKHKDKVIRRPFFKNAPPSPKGLTCPQYPGGPLGRF